MQRVVFIQLVVGLLIGGGLGALTGHFGKCATGACPLTASPWRGGLIGAMIGGMLAFSVGSPRSEVQAASSASEAVGPVAASGPAVPVHIGSAEAFDRIIQQADRPVLADFYADWCGPCRMLAPIIEKLAKEYQGRVVVCKVNVDHLPQVAAKYGIQGIPAVLVFDKGKEAQRLVGVRPQGEYARALDQLVGQAP